jgi:Flp pilus assembly CpaF family ATPase
VVEEQVGSLNGAAAGCPGAGAHLLPPAQDAQEWRQVAGWLRGRVADALAARAGGAGLGEDDRRALAVELVRDGLREQARAAAAAGRAPLAPGVEDRIAAAVLDGLFGLGGLQRLLDDPMVENIDVNGADRVFVRRAGGVREPAGPVADCDAELVELVRTVAARAGVGERRFDAGHPAISVQLPDGSRLFAVIAVCARPCVSIRRHRFLRVRLSDLVGVGTVSPAVAGWLAAAVRARRNILVCGGTGAGKTTLLRALAAEISPAERLVTIEDTLELFLDQDRVAHPDCVALQVREPNIEDAGGIDQAALVRHALRMSPDRVIVGEVRGAELVPMLNAMSQGSDGSIATVHASSSRGVFTKLAAYGAQAPERLGLEATNLLLAEAVHLVVYLAFDRSTGARVVSSVLEVAGAQGPLVAANEVFRPGPGGAAVPGTPPSHGLREALARPATPPAALLRALLRGVVGGERAGGRVGAGRLRRRRRGGGVAGGHRPAARPAGARRHDACGHDVGGAGAGGPSPGAAGPVAAPPAPRGGGRGGGVRGDRVAGRCRAGRSRGDGVAGNAGHRPRARRGGGADRGGRRVGGDAA